VGGSGLGNARARIPPAPPQPSPRSQALAGEERAEQRQTSASHIRRELIMMITPHGMRPDRDRHRGLRLLTSITVIHRQSVRHKTGAARRVRA